MYNNPQYNILNFPHHPAGDDTPHKPSVIVRYTRSAITSSRSRYLVSMYVTRIKPGSYRANIYVRRVIFTRALRLLMAFHSHATGESRIWMWSRLKSCAHTRRFSPMCWCTATSSV